MMKIKYILFQASVDINFSTDPLCDAVTAYFHNNGDHKMFYKESVYLLRMLTKVHSAFSFELILTGFQVN